MKPIRWSEEKNSILIAERGVSFEECVRLIELNEVVDIIKNKYPYEHQDVYVLRINGYIHYVPAVEDDEKIFLKTIFPTHKANKAYENK